MTRKKHTKAIDSFSRVIKNRIREYNRVIEVRNIKFNKFLFTAANNIKKYFIKLKTTLEYKRFFEKNIGNMKKSEQEIWN
jgi:hypothetical protein